MGKAFDTFHIAAIWMELLHKVQSLPCIHFPLTPGQGSFLLLAHSQAGAKKIQGIQPAFCHFGGVLGEPRVTHRDEYALSACSHCLDTHSTLQLPYSPCPPSHIISIVCSLCALQLPNLRALCPLLPLFLLIYSPLSPIIPIRYSPQSATAIYLLQPHSPPPPISRISLFPAHAYLPPGAPRRPPAWRRSCSLCRSSVAKRAVAIPSAVAAPGDPAGPAPPRSILSRPVPPLSARGRCAPRPAPAPFRPACGSLRARDSSPAGRRQQGEGKQVKYPPCPVRERDRRLKENPQSHAGHLLHPLLVPSPSCAPQFLPCTLPLHYLVFPACSINRTQPLLHPE